MTKVNFLNNIQPNKSWDTFLDCDTLTLLSDVESYLKSEEYYPNQNDVLRFLNNDSNNVKVVILGIDPYHSSFTTSTGTKDCVATGRSFELKNIECFTQKYRQASLRNIFKLVYQLQNNISKCTIKEIRNSDSNNLKSVTSYFDDLEKNGVLLLNFAFTVKPGEASSHIAVWEKFTEALIKYIVNKVNPSWIILGKESESRFKDIISKSSIDDDKCHFLPHPASKNFIKTGFDYFNQKENQQNGIDIIFSIFNN